ncbi:hypothetical protein M947_06405 [Sulfurimonas hongkongensis]|uniref:POTRA domain-containing protein n=1 Tax=Sulfurimonas hongkongensis TaxID=1172190 RepID=T0JNB3_9BACT|nr:ShlB/FhaC/HecB family hemolysin secretion/activation protein [Sulfurimonas hongkongensis]EQB39621.1 hypothetical protein M947_06405 [Sulfurimonas hongkongensis]
MSINKTIVATIITSTIALAATPPRSGEILREVEPRKLPRDLKAVPSIKVEKFKAPIADDKGVKIEVKDFTIEGNSVYSSDILLSLLDKYKNKKLTISQLQEAAGVITKYYRDHGYFVARAYIPAQELQKTNAVVQIVVIEGLYGKFSIDNSSLVDDAVVQGYMDKLSSQVISIPSLERELLLLDELKGAVVTTTRILPGSEVGKSDFTVTLKDEARYNSYVIADNYGSIYTGRYRINAIGFVNSLNKRGDVLGINALVSNTADLKNIRLSYDTPVGYDGLALNFSFSKTYYKVGKEFESQDIHGDSLSFNTGISYPIIKQRAHNLTASLNYTYYDITDNDIAQHEEKSLNTFSLSLEDTIKTSFFNKEGLLNTTLSLSKGYLSLDSDDAKANDSVLQSQGHYEKVNFSISQTQFLVHNVSAVARIKAQKSLGKNLDGVEDIFIGGSLGARSYTSSEASGDNGYLTSLEVFYHLPSYTALTHNISAFIDHGKVWFDEDQTTSLNDRVLSSVGIGYNVNYKNLSLGATFAHGFGKDKTPTSENDDTSLNRFFFQAIARF